MRIGIIAALPGELKPLVRGWQRMPVARGSGLRMWMQVRGEDELIAVCAGMGAGAARRAFTAAEHAGSLDIVFSIGLAGALTADTRSGEAYPIAEVIEAQTGERIASLPRVSSLHRLVTTPTVAQEAEKRRLAASYSATLVDMEAAIVGRLAEMRGIPFYCVKAVSDDLHHRLLDLNLFIDVSGGLKMGKLLAHVAARPQYWWPLMQLGSNSAVAGRALAKMVDQVIEGMQRRSYQDGLRGAKS